MIYLFVYMSEETNVSLLDQDLLLLVERVHLCIIGLQVEGKPRSIEKEEEEGMKCFVFCENDCCFSVFSSLNCSK